MKRAMIGCIAAVLQAACSPGNAATGTGGADAATITVTEAASFAVSGSAIHYFSSAAVHSQEPTPSGQVQRSSEVIRLTGDLDGFILYHPTSVFDFVAGTLVNTGTQLFSGTVRGSAPMILHDDRFRFIVDLASGATSGLVHLSRSRDAPHPGAWFDCELVVTGTGLTEAGDGMADYSGTCIARGR